MEILKHCTLHEMQKPLNFSVSVLVCLKNITVYRGSEHEHEASCNEIVEFVS